MKNEILTKDVLVLIIDDEDRLRESISRALSLFVSTITAGTPQEALEKVTAHDVSLCLIDQNLRADLTGIELAKEIKAIVPHVRIIMLTGESDSQVVINAINSGAIDSFLSKPFRIEQLKEYMEENLIKQINREDDIEQIINKIRKGKEITDEEIGRISNDMGKLESLMFEHRITVNPNQEDDVMLIGVVIFDKNEVIYSQILDDEFSINNEYMFKGLILTLSNISNELFELNEEAKLLDEIKLPNVHVKVSIFNEYGVVVFLSGDDSIPNVILKEIQSFIQKTELSIGNNFKPEDRNSLDAEVEILNRKIVDLQQ